MLRVIRILYKCFCKEVSQKKKRRFDWDSLQEYFSIQKKSDLNRWEIDNKLDSWTKWTLFDEYLEIGNWEENYMIILIYINFDTRTSGNNAITISRAFIYYILNDSFMFMEIKSNEFLYYLCFIFIVCFRFFFMQTRSEQLLIIFFKH